MLQLLDLLLGVSAVACCALFSLFLCVHGSTDTLVTAHAALG